MRKHGLFIFARSGTTLLPRTCLTYIASYMLDRVSRNSVSIHMDMVGAHTYPIQPSQTEGEGIVSNHELYNTLVKEFPVCIIFS